MTILGDMHMSKNDDVRELKRHANRLQKELEERRKEAKKHYTAAAECTTRITDIMLDIADTLKKIEAQYLFENIDKP